MAQVDKIRQRVKPVIAIIIALSMILTIALSFAFVWMHSEHEHHYGDCDICLKIENCQKLMKQVVTTTPVNLAVLFLGIFLFSTPQIEGYTSNAITLVTLKVKLSN